MREILFKAKNRYTDHKWEFGSLVYDAIGQPRIAQVDKSGKGLVFHKVIAETVCQYTGLTDKNGVKIFEGDVVKWMFGKHYWEAVISSRENSKSNTLYAIETFHNCTKNKDEDYIYERSDSRRGVRNDIEFLSRNIVVIGNIHDKETSEIPINQ